MFNIHNAQCLVIMQSVASTTGAAPFSCLKTNPTAVDRDVSLLAVGGLVGLLTMTAKPLAVGYLSILAMSSISHVSELSSRHSHRTAESDVRGDATAQAVRACSRHRSSTRSRASSQITQMGYAESLQPNYSRVATANASMHAMTCARAFTYTNRGTANRLRKEHAPQFACSDSS